MLVAFYLAAAIAIIATLLTITAKSVVRALLNLVVSFLAIAVAFYTLGAPYAAVLEVILYAGSIIVLFLIAGMLMDLRPSGTDRHRPKARGWLAPAALAAALVVEVIVLVGLGVTPVSGQEVGPSAVGLSLFGTYALGVEAASVLLLTGLVGVLHLGRTERAA